MSNIASMDGGVTSGAALAELDRVGRVVRDNSRWYRRYLLALGAGTVAYFAAVNLARPASSATMLLLALAWMAFMVGLTLWVRAQPVMWRGNRRARILLMVLYFSLVTAALVLNTTVLREVPWRWALGIVPAAPLLVGSWAVLRR